LLYHLLTDTATRRRPFASSANRNSAIRISSQSAANELDRLKRVEFETTVVRALTLSLRLGQEPSRLRSIGNVT